MCCCQCWFREDCVLTAASTSHQYQTALVTSHLTSVTHSVVVTRTVTSLLWPASITPVHQWSKSIITNITAPGTLHSTTVHSTVFSVFSSQTLHFSEAFTRLQQMLNQFIFMISWTRPGLTTIKYRMNRSLVLRI